MTHMFVLPSFGLRPGVSGDGLRGLSDGICAAGTYAMCRHLTTNGKLYFFNYRHCFYAV